MELSLWIAQDSPSGEQSAAHVVVVVEGVNEGRVNQYRIRLGHPAAAVGLPGPAGRPLAFPLGVIAARAFVGLSAHTFDMGPRVGQDHRNPFHRLRSGPGHRSVPDGGE